MIMTGTFVWSKMKHQNGFGNKVIPGRYQFSIVIEQMFNYITNTTDGGNSAGQMLLTLGF